LGVAAAHAFFVDLALVFSVAIIGGMVAWRLRLPLILGYVSGGLLLSRFTPGPYLSDSANFQLFAEIGVILLMFSIGAEFSLKDLVRVKWVALVGAPIGIALSILLGIVVGRALGYSTLQGALLGAIVSVASTMVQVRILVDRGELHTRHGSVMVAITLLEDLAVVAMTVIIPVLKQGANADYLAVAWTLSKAIAWLVPIWLLGSKVIPRMIGRVARTQTEELFLLVSLAICLGVAALVQATGLSLALGAFIAGMIISSSEYGHESLAQLLPMRDAFVALFFVTIGALVDPGVVVTHWPLLLSLLLMIVVGKFIIWALVVSLFREKWHTAVLVGIGLTQIGEFSFILVQVARDTGLLGAEVYSVTLTASLISILINALLFRYVPEIVQGHVVQTVATIHAAVEPDGHVLLCGYGRVGGAIGAALETFGCPYTVLEVNADIVSSLHKRGMTAFFGDPARAHVVEHAGVERAKLVVVAVPESDRAWLAVRNIRRLNPTVPIIARVQRDSDREKFMQAGATFTVQPEAEASVAMIRAALDFLNVSPDAYVRYLKSFRQALPMLEQQATHDDVPFVTTVRVGEQSEAVGRSLKQLKIRERFGVSVLSIEEDGVPGELNPSPDRVISQGAVLRVIGHPRQLTEFQSFVESRMLD
jgi:CPA2 family monovalent cation:H+ antiporter-2